MVSSLLLALLLQPTSTAIAAEEPVEEVAVELSAWQAPRDLLALFREAEPTLRSCPAGPLVLGESLRMGVRWDPGASGLGLSVDGGELPEELASCVEEALLPALKRDPPGRPSEGSLVWIGKLATAVEDRRLVRDFSKSLTQQMTEAMRERPPLVLSSETAHGQVTLIRVEAGGGASERAAKGRLARMLPDCLEAWERSEARPTGTITFSIRPGVDGARNAVAVTEDRLVDEVLRDELSALLSRIRLLVKPSAVNLVEAQLGFVARGG